MAYYVIMNLPLSEGNVLTATTPIWISILSALFLDEKFTII